MTCDTLKGRGSRNGHAARGFGAATVNHLEHARLAYRFAAPPPNALFPQEIDDLSDLVTLGAHMTHDRDDVLLALVGLERPVRADTKSPPRLTPIMRSLLHSPSIVADFTAVVDPRDMALDRIAAIQNEKVR